MYSVHHDVDGEMLSLFQRHSYVLMFGKPERCQCVLYRIMPLCTNGNLSWRPREYVVIQCVFATNIQERYALHFIGGSIEETEIVLRPYDVSIRAAFPPCARVGIEFCRQVFEKSREATDRVLPAVYLFGDHSGSSSLAITVRNVVVISARVEFN
jgi:hypothetical protein